MDVRYTGWWWGILAASVAACSGVGEVQPAQSDEGSYEAQSRRPGGSSSSDYVVLAWNDLGMHCLNPSYDEAVILPPYNTVNAQVIKRGSPPELVTSGVTVSYAIVGNTYSYGKGDYGQFWDEAPALFGVSLARDTGLNLVDPSLHNGLSGKMVVASGADHFEVNGIPLTPIKDDGTWNPYQVATITVKSTSGKVLAQTQATVPTSDEISCSTCHGPNALTDVLEKHDLSQGTHLTSSAPVLCASCHGSPVLGQVGPGSSGRYLSDVMHSFHADKGATCYNCHPGAKTQCSRSKAHTAAGGNCTTCHGDMAQVGGSVASGRLPWVEEPKCASCHTGVAEVDTGATLYRDARGHGGVFCAGCHGSPHAMIPTTVASDSYQAVQYQGKALTIGDCRVCHQTSRGGGSSASDFAEEHGGLSPQHTTACNVCHTSTPSTQSRWPHAFQWKRR